MLSIDVLPFNPLQVNTCLVIDPDSNCLVIDPSFSGKEEAELFLAHLDEKGLKAVGQLNTHCHVDHVPGVRFLKEHFGLPMRAHRGEEHNLGQAPMLASLFGLEEMEELKIDEYLEHGDRIMLGDEHLLALHVPGHSDGSLAFYSESGGFVITGDALFRESIGRTDLHGGDFDTLIASIRQQLLSLPGGTRIVPGHGPDSTIAYEATNNPFLNLPE